MNVTEIAPLIEAICPIVMYVIGDAGLLPLDPTTTGENDQLYGEVPRVKSRISPCDVPYAGLALDERARSVVCAEDVAYIRIRVAAVDVTLSSAKTRDMLNEVV